MGAGASIEGDAPITRSRAEELAGPDEWARMEAQFDFEADESGCVAAARVRDYMSDVGGSIPSPSLSPSKRGSKMRRASYLALATRPGPVAGEEEGEELDDLILSPNVSRWKFLRHAVQMAGYGKCTKEDLDDSMVKEMMLLIDGNPTLSDQNLDDQIRSAAMTEEELEERHAARRERIAREAAEHVSRFENMSAEERADARNDGDMDHYTEENQAKREAMFDDDVQINYHLDQWWRAAETYIDRDKTDALEAEEYAVFHKRLLKIVQEAEMDGMTQEEQEEMMQQDFKADSGEDGSVDKEEFRYAVFQMADQWTCSADIEEYVEFLKRGFKVVFQDLIDADKIIAPKEWSLNMKKTKGITPMPMSRVADVMSGILDAKIKADKVDNEKGNAQQTMAEFVVDHFKNRHGAGKNATKFLKAFALALVAVIEDDKNEYHDLCLLFAQMCGFYALSGRIQAYPHECSEFILLHVDAVRDLLSKSSLLSNSESVMEEPGNKAAEKKKTARGGADARTKALVSGLLNEDKTRVYLGGVIEKELKLPVESPLYKVSMVSLSALSAEVPVKPRGKERVIQAMRFVTLLGVIYHAWNNGRK